MSQPTNEVYSDRDFTVVGFLRSRLQSAGIPCYIRNEHTSTSMAAIPIPLFWPALCVADERDLAAARALVAAYVHAPPDDRHDWRCPHCGELVPAAFEVCWKCEIERPPAG